MLMFQFIHDISCSRLNLNYVKYYIIWFNMLWFGKVFDFKSSQMNQFFRTSALLNLSCFQSFYLSEAEKNTGLQKLILFKFFFIRLLSLSFQQEEHEGLTFAQANLREKEIKLSQIGLIIVGGIM